MSLLSTGQVLNQRYRVVKLLGQGGFGAVYRVWDVNFQIPCALKENFETSPESQRQFQREAQMLHTLRHPNLPLVKDYFIIPGQGQYLVMDYVAGEDLQELLTRNKKPFPESHVINWLLQVCEALIYLHSQVPQVIHRDIKPANIKISGGSETDPGKAVLVDFGIAKVFQPGSPTTQGARAVSPGFAPFEQYGHAPTDARTDLYALGATAYALLTAQIPTESIARVAGTELPKPRQINPVLSQDMETIILKCMAQMPAERYQTARELFDALNGLANIEPITSSIETPSIPAPGGNSSVQMSGVKDSSSMVGSVLPSINQPASKPKAKTPMMSGKKKKFTWLWIMVVIFLLLAAVGAFGWWAGWFNIESYSPSTGGIEGEWNGQIHTVNSGTVSIKLELHPSDDPRFFNGILELRYPDGRFERNPVEGTIDGAEFRMRDFREMEGLYLWGMKERDVLVGMAAWGCYMCEGWGEFELRH